MLGCGQFYLVGSLHFCNIAREAGREWFHTLNEGSSSSSTVSLLESERGVARMVTLDAWTSCKFCVSGSKTPR